MRQDSYLPKIVTQFESSDEPNHLLYSQALRNTLKKILPEHTFEGPSESHAENLHSLFPFVFNPTDLETPANLSFYALFKYRANAFQFFFQMVSHWLIPPKRLNAVWVHAVDFRMPEVSHELYTLCEVMVHVDNPVDLEEIHYNLPRVEREAKLGLKSSYYAQRILGIKGLSLDEKTALVQDHIAFLIQRQAHHFDQDVVVEMQHTFAMCSDNFKTERESRHLCRVISVSYLFRKAIREAVRLLPEKRYLSLKIFRASIHLPKGDRTVLAILVGINFLKDKEVFEKRHLLTAIQNYIPNAQAVEDSFFVNRRGAESICTLYLEIEKDNGESFTSLEIQILRKELPIDLKDRIEHLMQPVFMPRNEEEIMRNVLILSNQVKYTRDIPQVIINFDEQTHTSLFFTIILVRVLRPQAQSIQDLFKYKKSLLTYIHDRCKAVGTLRKKFVKEATVFRVKISKEQFLRRDHSIDLYKARQMVCMELCRVVGEVRDYNGGMISKQNELLDALRNLMGESMKYHELLLENFFYSLMPVTMRAILNPECLKTLFEIQLEALDSQFSNGEGYTLKMRLEQDFVYVMIKAQDRSIKDELMRNFTKQQIPTFELTNSYVKIYDIPYIGFLYRCNDYQKQCYFCQLVHNVVNTWEFKRRAYEKEFRE